MKEKFLKARIPAELYEALQARAGMEGKRLGTHVREVLERDAHAITTCEALTRIEAMLSQQQPAQAPTVVPALDHGTRVALAEIRLLARELALASNAQILARVAAQMAAQTSQLNS